VTRIPKALGKLLIKRRLGAPSAIQKKSIATFRAQMAGLPPLESANGSPADAEWLENRRQLRELAASGDPRRFLEWDVVGRTMFVGDATYIPIELRELQASARWQTRWRAAIREDSVGLPQRCRWRLASSGNLIHHAYTVDQFERATARNLESFEQIIEFGGGYGSFCRLARRLGFGGEYVIVDFPEFCALQRYFLQSVKYERRGREHFNAHFVTDIERLSDAARPTNTLLIALWSLSETPLDLRRSVLQALGDVPNVLIAYQDQFGEVDNLEFFNDWQRRNDSRSWTTIDIPQLPGNHYLFGVTASPVARTYDTTGAS
jgi:hypothetical protein